MKRIFDYLEVDIDLLMFLLLFVFWIAFIIKLIFVYPQHTFVAIVIYTVYTLKYLNRHIDD